MFSLFAGSGEEGIPPASAAIEEMGKVFQARVH